MLNKIKVDFKINKIKFVVIALAVALWIIGFVTNSTEKTEVLGGVFVILCVAVFSYFIAGSGILKEHPMPVFISCCLFLLILILFKMLFFPGYAIENSTLILTTLIFGELPYAFNGKKTVATAIGAAIAVLFSALLAYLKLWWLVIHLLYIAPITQITTSHLGQFGERSGLRSAEVLLFNSVPFIVVLKFMNYPGIEVSFAPLSSIEIVSALLILAFTVCSFLCISKSDRWRFFAIAGVISIAVQAMLSLATKGNPVLLDTFGLPFLQGNNLNMAFTAMVVGFVLSPSSCELVKGEHK